MEMERTFLFLAGAPESSIRRFYEDNLKRVMLFFGDGTAAERMFHKLLVATTRRPGKNEINGYDYYFCHGDIFGRKEFIMKFPMIYSSAKSGRTQMATCGVPRFELERSYPKSVVSIGLKPAQIRQMIDWLKDREMRYNYEIVLFDGSNRAPDNACMEGLLAEFQLFDLMPDWIVLAADGGLDAKWRVMPNGRIMPKDAANAKGIIRAKWNLCATARPMHPLVREFIRVVVQERYYA